MGARFATCHPDRKHKAKGLCGSCYSRQASALWRARNPIGKKEEYQQAKMEMN